MLKAFERSREAKMCAAVLSQGLFGRMLLVGILADFVALSEFHIKRDEISAQDINDRVAKNVGAGLPAMRRASGAQSQGHWKTPGKRPSA